MSIFEYDEEKHIRMMCAEVFEEGENLGATKKLITQTCRKLKKGKTAETIADELDEYLDTIKSICDVAEHYAPDYDIEAICNELQKGK